ncbi:uncharacterized protein LOC126553989 [Aphis gossypii]|uniref:uncharacterized protein LOC126553989 n=1 Tax=Aphis gossypii TaxID=80765 RepID=UPI0021592504|nr:uncharacterized protein LOC126553989 [Aphis gossypii]
MRTISLWFAMASAGLTMCTGLLGQAPVVGSKNAETYEKIHNQEAACDNGGITWFGSSYTGPGNKLYDANNKFIGCSLPRTEMDKVTFQHDVDYNNMTNPTKDQVWEADKKSILAAMNTTDKYYGNVATIVGLGLKNIAERTHEAITGSNSAIYPQCGRVEPEQKDNAAQGAESKGNEEPPDTTTKSTNNTDSNGQLRTDHQHVDNFDNNFSTSGNNMETPTSSSKRAADSPAGASFSKKSNMVLPGTASATASDSDTGNPSPENAVLPRPNHISTGYTMVFKKCHSFISYGLAWKMLDLSTTVKGLHVVTTSLNHIPVEYPFLYLSPSEYRLVSTTPGSLCKHVKVNVVMRNPRTAFETNATTSSLATLNQNKFAVVAHNLTNITRGVNYKYGFGTTNAMNPTSCSDDNAKYQEETIQAMYGCKYDGKPIFTGEFDGIPNSFFHLPFHNNHYYTMVADKGHSTKLGWPLLNELITKIDASFTTGKTIAEYSYSPKLGLLGKPIEGVFNGISGKSLTGNDIVIMVNKKNRRAGFTQIQINKNTEKVNDTETEELRDDSYTNYLTANAILSLWNAVNTYGVTVMTAL